MNTNILLGAIILVFFTSCSKSEDTLFRRVDVKESGLDFRNTLVEDKELNIINLDYFYNGGGVGIGDFNSDGLDDIFFSGNMVPNKLFINTGNLKFKDVSAEAGIGGGEQWKSGVEVGDVNNDGKLDIYVCATIRKDSVLRRNLMYINKGNSADGVPVFENQAQQMGLADESYTSDAGFLDYDNDGDLDLYVLTNARLMGHVAYKPKVDDGSSVNTDRLYRNNGDGTFTEVSKSVGILADGYGLGLGFLDVNKDGWTDIYVCNDYISNDHLYINHKGVFKNEIDSYIKHQSKFAMGNDIADFNNDGLVDIVTVDMLPDNNLRKKTVISGSGYITYINDAKFGYTHQYVRNMLQLNNGNGTFSEIGQLAGIYETEWSWSPLFADFDNDGFKDLIITNGFPKDITDRDFISFREKTLGIATTEQILEQVPSVKVSNFVFKNNGDLTFTNVAKEWGFDHPSFSNGAAYADLDNDGDLDYVINNVNDVVSLYENRLYHNNEDKESHYLRIKLKTNNGKPVLGTKITLRNNGKLQYAEYYTHRGYVSSVENAIHFGLGEVTSVDSVLVEWPDGKLQLLRNVQADKVHEVSYAPNFETPVLNSDQRETLRETTKDLNLSYKHKEDVKIDYNIQRTLPHKMTQRGPSVAAGDINGDGLEDFIAGGSAGFSTQAFIRQEKGGFIQKDVQKSRGKNEEDGGVLLFDAEGDGDLDLYCVSTSYEFDPGSALLNDRFYRNNGEGEFSLDAQALPRINSSGSCVRAADFDADNDLDLFVGGHVPLGKYPLADSSYVLINENGKFIKGSGILDDSIFASGIINDAIWSDFDNDSQMDLVVVGEFMPVSFFRNDGKKLVRVSESGVQDYKGWFNSISAADFDSDGDTDYIAGNLGINNYYNCSREQPLKIYAKDYDNNGSMDAILTCYTKDENGQMKSFPVHFWDELNSTSPKFRRKFSTYAQFAKTPTDQFFTPDDLKDAIIREANYMHTSFIENLGNGKFKMVPLATEVQLAPVNGMVVDYLNADAIPDVLLVGNNYSSEPTYGQYDAFTGLVLFGKESGGFEIIPSRKSGFFVNGDAKGMVKVSGGAEPLYVVTQNLDSLKIFSPSASARPSFSPEADDAWAVLEFPNGKKQKIEFYYGNGYYSQSSRVLELPDGITGMTVYKFNGKNRKVADFTKLP